MSYRAYCLDCHDSWEGTDLDGVRTLAVAHAKPGHRPSPIVNLDRPLPPDADQLSRIAIALESIAVSLEYLAHPLLEVER